MHPTKMQINANNHSGCSSGVKQVCGRLYKVIQVHIKPSRVSPFLFAPSCKHIKKVNYKKETCTTDFYYIPPTSVTIQSGIARLTMAKTSAAIKRVALTVVNLSIMVFSWLQKPTDHCFLLLLVDRVKQRQAAKCFIQDLFYLCWSTLLFGMWLNYYDVEDEWNDIGSIYLFKNSTVKFEITFNTFEHECTSRWIGTWT